MKIKPNLKRIIKEIIGNIFRCSTTVTIEKFTLMKNNWLHDREVFVIDY